MGSTRHSDCLCKCSLIRAFRQQQQFSYFAEKPLELAPERKPHLLIFVRVDVFLTSVDKIAAVFGLNLIVAKR